MKETSLQFRLTLEEVEAISKAAEIDKRSKSSLCRYASVEYAKKVLSGLKNDTN